MASMPGRAWNGVRWVRWGRFVEPFSFPENDGLPEDFKEVLKSGSDVALVDWISTHSSDEVHSVLQSVKVLVEGTKTYCDTPPEYPRIFAAIRCLSWPVQKEHLLKIAESFLAAGCKIEEKVDIRGPSTRSRAGFTPLVYAVENGCHEWVSVLLDLGADIKARDTNGFTPLHWACFMGDDPQMMEILWNRGGKDLTPENTPPEFESVPPVVHTAVDQGRDSIVRYLLQAGCDINTMHSYRVIAEKDWMKALKSRYNCGDVQKEMISMNCISRGVRMRKLWILEFLLKYPLAEVLMHDFHYAILEGDSTAANMLLEHMDLGQINLPGRKVVGNDKILIHCLGQHAYANILDNRQLNKLYETSQLLTTYVALGLDINSIIEDTGETFLSTAVGMKGGNPALIRTLIQSLHADPLLPRHRSAFQLALNNFSASAADKTLSIFFENEKIAFNILDSGISASKLRLTELNEDAERIIFDNLKMVEKLWWSGARLSPYRFARPLPEQMEHWMKELAVPNDCSLQRLTVRKIRECLTFPYLEGLSTAGFPPIMKQWIRSPNYIAQRNKDNRNTT